MINKKRYPVNPVKKTGLNYYKNFILITTQTLTEKTFFHGLRFLSKNDSDLEGVLNELGPPPMWKRKPGFTTLVHIILEQQVSLASAKAAFDRLIARVSPLTPANFLKQDDAKLKAIGFSRQKTDYCRHLAQAISKGQLNLAGLNLIDDNTVRKKLIAVKGIGLWTANIYLLMALRRPDIWPVRDLALAVAAQRLKKLSSRPTPDELDSIGSNWKPWRAVAARILWHYYLQNIKRKR